MTDEKKRHGCLTAWLILMLLANSLTTLAYTLGGDAIAEALPEMPGWAVPALAVMGLFNLVCTVALFKWKKWGFYGFAASCVLGLAINMSVGVNDLSTIVGGVVGFLFLFGVLQIGGDKSGWKQLD